MNEDAVQWVANKLGETDGLKVVERTPEGFLVVRSEENYSFLVAVLGVRDLIEVSDVEPLFTGATKPQFVVNVPSRTLWSGAAIGRIHAASAAFGTLGEVSRAAHTEDAGSYRNKNMDYFINAMQQHKNVHSVSYVYETVFRVHRMIGPSLTVAVIDAYNMSAEDVRNAKARFGHFDVVVKSSSYGSITSAAADAADSIGAQALTFGGLMQRLGK
ncbi:hypothetical protein BTK96_000287 [Burkholderia pyrrocinia]|uniref:hypothetical protein n=1 Tax=Burkholderia sp. IT-111MI5 TaxID=3026439 RepID=UPI002A32FA49|nr:hypothetical protein [Burkholderia pyrrocinia]EKS9893938.1 hypothetical protein [Burkholderia pyrrocinia]EKS9911148.1 hypothetical protein [Burkholderia pyrrocinia]